MYCKSRVVVKVVCERVDTVVEMYSVVVALVLGRRLLQLRTKEPTVCSVAIFKLRLSLRLIIQVT